MENFQTQPLLQFRAISHRLQNLIIRIIHGRLLRAASLHDRKLILECYHPSAKYTEPYLYCDYLGTPGLSDSIEGKGTIYQIADDPKSGATLHRLYSRFRPTRKDPDPKVPRSHPAGDIAGSRTSEAAESSKSIKETDVVRQSISLEAHELFSQLCFSANLVQIGPRKGVFISSVDAIETKTIRIWRQWLAERATKSKESGIGASTKASKESDHGTRLDESDSDELIWVDLNRVAGLRLRVKERKWRRDVPILMHKDEDHAVSYSLELDGSYQDLKTVITLCRTDNEQSWSSAPFI